MYSAALPSQPFTRESSRPDPRNPALHFSKHARLNRDRKEPLQLQIVMRRVGRSSFELFAPVVSNRALGGDGRNAPTRLHQAPRLFTSASGSTIIPAMSGLVASLGAGAPLHVATLAGVAAWIFLYLWLAVGNAPAAPALGPVTNDLSDEPPAVAGLLANGFTVPKTSMPATVLDLAARRYVEIALVAGGHHLIHVRPKDASDLAPFEHHVLGHIKRLAVGGVVPAAALASGTKAASQLRWSRFKKLVIANAQGRGLCVNRWSPGQLGTLAVGLGLLVPTTFVAVRSEQIGIGRSPLAVLVVVAFGLAAFVYGRLISEHAQRDTRRGLLAAGRWLGIRTALAKNESFGVLPPSSVAIWERHLAYAASFGLAPASCAGLPLGPEEDRVAWSSEGGRWRRVRVVYRWRPWWGTHPAVALALTIPLVLATGLFVRWSGPATWRILTGTSSLYGGLRPIVATFGTLSAIGLAAAAYAFVSVLAGLASEPVTVTGVVLRARERTRFFHPRDDAKRYFVAVDDGSHDRIVAACVDERTFAMIAQGDRLRITYRRGLGVATEVVHVPKPATEAS